MALEIKTSIIINASAEEVWKEFTNFQSYPEWNPFIKSIEGEVKLNNKIKAEISSMTFKPKILIYDSNEKLEWRGRLLFPCVFDGRHTFEIIDNGDGTTTFIQREKFRGILVPFFKKKLLTETKDGFNNMNLALKKRIEHFKTQ